MSEIKTWSERALVDCCRSPSADYMLWEIAELREALKTAQDSCDSNAKAAEDYYHEKQSLLDQRESWRCLASKFEQERDHANDASAAYMAELEEWRFTNRIDELQRSQDNLQEQLNLALDTIESRDRNIEAMADAYRELQSKLRELNLQYISDFGQLQERKAVPLVNCDDCIHSHKDADSNPCRMCNSSVEYGSKFEPRSK